jgi:hypothetical protein
MVVGKMLTNLLQISTLARFFHPLIDHEDWMEKSCQGGDL